MSVFKDDDEELPSRSSAEYLTRADHGKQEQREKNAASKGDLLALQRAVLRTQVQPDATSGQLTANDKDDHAREQKLQQAPAEVTKGGTKTLTQQADQQLEEADESDTADTLRNKAQRHEAAKKQAGEEYQQNMS